MYVSVGLLILLTVSTLHVQTREDSSEDTASLDLSGRLNLSGHRGKRSAILGKIVHLGVNLVWKGIKATEFLLKGAVKARSSKPHVKEYQKIGTPMTALKDFRSVDPIYVQKLQLPGGVAGRSGHVGDRTVTLKMRGDSGKPTIEIMKTHKSSDGSVPEIDRITYTKEFYN